MSGPATLPSRALILVAHPDDESIGCGILLQRMREPTVVFATDGAPRAQEFWKGHESRQAYAESRKREALQALELAGVEQAEFLGDYGPEIFVDQELFQHLSEALDVLMRLGQIARPRVLLTHAYEGGHPDHDCCSFLAHALGRRFGIPVWEMPFYYSMQEPKGVQRFLTATAESAIEANDDELGRKSQMVASYLSQREFLRNFELNAERFRPQPAYDYSRPPHDGVLNYEAWGWPIKGRELCSAFMQVQPRRAAPKSARAARQARQGHVAGA